MSDESLRLQREIDQRRPFGSLAVAAVVALMRTSDHVRARLADLLGASDLSPQQYNVLRILRGAGEPLPTLEIAARMIERAPGITRLLDRLEAKGLVTRARCAHDRRRVLCSATDAALALLADLDAPVRRADEAAMAALGEEELSRLLGLLERIRCATAPVPPLVAD